jgi:replicative DNA helicase
MTMLSEALDYARRGWYVFPCREKPGTPYTKNNETIIPTEKSPYVAKGLDDATLDEDQINAWWKKWPDALIGINAGKSGLFVIDIDKKHVNGLDTFMLWNINDSAGLHSFTPSGGTHIIFTGVGKSSTNAKTGIDTRGDGGYFIAPPSKILEGEYCGEYKRIGDWGITPGIIPDGLMAKLFPDKTVEYVKGTVSFEGGVKQLSRASLNFLAVGAPTGERNSTLFKVLADFAGCGYTRERAKEIVLPVCTRINLPISEFEQVLTHAYSKPRTSSIPDSIQEKIAEGGKNVASKITFEEQTVMEDALLAFLLKDNTLIPTIQDILNFEDFNVFKNRIIYKAINRIYNAGMKVDFITISNEISKESNKITLDDVSKMVNQYFTNTDSAVSYAYIIKEKSYLRKIENVLDNKAKYMKSGSLIEIVSNLEKDISDIALYGGAKSTNVLTGKQAVDMVTDHTRKLVNGEIELLKTGFTEYDKEVGGFYPTEFVVCAARAGDGKSGLALSIANEVALKQNKGVGFFSLEMSTHETICRLVSQLTGIPFKNVYQGKLGDTKNGKNLWDDYKEAMEQISDSRLYFDDGFGMTVPEIRSKIRKLVDKDIKLVVIDQLEQIRGHEGQPLYVQFDRIAYEIKDLTKEFNIPIFLNHQLNRSSTDRKLKNPELQLSDLNQAGEKPATQVWAIAHNKDDKGKIVQSKIKLLKNRNGPRLEFAVIFVGERILFSNPTREEDKYVFHSTDEKLNGDSECRATSDKAFWEDD